jgi:hypothetical protein
MKNQKNPILANPVPWLLEEDNPSVCYWTLVEILESPEDSPEVIEARVALTKSPLVELLFELQKPEGFWGDDETKPYTAKGAVGVLNLLHKLGVPPDDRTAAGCDSFLRFAQSQSGGFSLVKTRPSGIFPCTTGEHLPFLIYFGFGDDPRVRKAFDFVVESMASEDALVCGRYQHQECLWGAIAALKGLKVLPEDLRNSNSHNLIMQLAHTLLNAPYDFDGEHKRWFTFGVPRAWDLLSALSVLAVHGYGTEPRFVELLDLVLEKQDDQGRWLCGSVSRTYPLERRNRPSKWVTLDVLRLLKTLGYTFPQTV